MELQLLSQFENPLLQRKEIKVVATFQTSTPSREDLKKEVCQKFNFPEETTVIRKIFQEKGLKRAICFINVYSSKEAMEKIEAKHILERKKKKKGEAPQAQEAQAGEAQAQEGGING
jgi:ribosomal protein S24E